MSSNGSSKASAADNAHPSANKPLHSPTTTLPVTTAKTRTTSINQGLQRPAHEKYSRALYKFSALSARSLYAGRQYHNLSDFLVRDTSRPGSGTSTSQPDNPIASFAKLYVLDGRPECHTTPQQLQSQEEISSLTAQGSQNRVLILRGYPEASLLARIGERLNLDYEYLYQHFSNSAQLHVGESHCLPPLSLISTETIQMAFTSIGSWDNYRSRIDLKAARRKLGKELQSYVTDLNRGDGVKSGDSMVRSFYLHDLHHFSITQQMTIKLMQTEDSWTLVVWTDCGTSLDLSHRGPWCDIQNKHSSTTRFLPIILDINNRLVREITNRTTGLAPPIQKPATIIDVEGAENLEQTISTLHEELLRPLDCEITKRNPFYVLHEVFRAVAASQYQFLNLMATKIHAQGRFDEEWQDTIFEIQGIKRLVDQQTDQIQEILEIIENRGGPSWPRSKPSSQDVKYHDEAERSADRLARTFRRLARQSKTVSASCKDAMSTLNNDAMVQDAQKSMKTAEGMVKLTLIAFVFVPLSFTTSFFGMNFSELDQDKLNLWVWFTVSIPVLSGSILVWWLDVRKCKSAWRSIVSSCFKPSVG